MTSSPPRAMVRELHLRQGRLSFTCDPDFNVAQVGLVTRWTPVKNLTFAAEVGAFFLDQKFSGVATLATLRLRSRPPCTSSRTRHRLPEPPGSA